MRSLAQRTKKLHICGVFNRLKVESHKETIFSRFFQIEKKRDMCKIADDNGDAEKKIEIATWL